MGTAPIPNRLKTCLFWSFRTLLYPSQVIVITYNPTQISSPMSTLLLEMEAPSILASDTG